ncbi:TPA: helix-turn-helix domain-containing protein [Serratia fonticola]
MTIHEEMLIDGVMLWIEENMLQVKNIDSVATKSGYSKWYLQRVFKKITGESLGRYLMQKKMERATKLLTETTLTINEIAIQLNYDSQQTFHRAFSRWQQVSPGYYRKTRTLIVDSPIGQQE